MCNATCLNQQGVRTRHRACNDLEGGLVMVTQVNHIHVVRGLASLFVCLFNYLFVIYRPHINPLNLQCLILRIPNHLLFLSHSGLIWCSYGRLLFSYFQVHSFLFVRTSFLQDNETEKIPRLENVLKTYRCWGYGEDICFTYSIQW